MHPLMVVVAFTLLAGMAMPFGALLASVERIRSHWLEAEIRHGIMAFGGGALLAAVALVLVPDGIAHLSQGAAALYFCLGGVVFMGLDILLYKMRTSASQLAAMLTDFIPESLALGAAFALSVDNALLLAVLTALQNVPEGFNAYHELHGSSLHRRPRIILMFAAMALLGPVAGVAGYLWLADYPTQMAAVMLAASGGILYSIFQDIAPQVPLKKHWAPPLGALLGFALGIVGHMLVLSRTV